MKRSISFSNIPVPTQFKRDSRSREQGKANSRRSSSAENYLTPLGVPGSSRRLQFGDGTPLTSNTLHRSSSLNRGYKTSISRNKSPSHSKYKQLISDKKWVSEQFSKVKNYIAINSQAFGEECTMNLKPPTITTFIVLASNLINPLLETDPINSINYGDIIGDTLKLLQYPGPITNSMFRSINTMTNWPNFISIISWLIELNEQLNTFPEPHNETDRAKVNMRHEFQSYFYDKVKEFNMAKECQSDDRQKIYEILGVDLQSAMKLEEKVNSQTLQVNSLKEQVDNIKSENIKLKEDFDEMRRVINNYEEVAGKLEQQLQKKIDALKSLHNDTANKKIKLVQQVKDLKKTISKQPCTFAEKEKKMQELADLQTRIERMKRVNAEYVKIRDNLDFELQSLMPQISQAVDQWNVAVAKTFLPEFMSLHLRDERYHAPDFLEKVEECNKAREKLVQKYEEQYHDLELKLAELKMRRRSINMDKEKYSNEADISELKKSIALLQEKNKNLRVAKNDDEKEFKAKMEAKKASAASEEEKLDNEIEELQKRIKQDSEAFDNMIIELVEAIKEAHKSVKENLLNVQQRGFEILDRAKEHIKKNRGGLEELLQKSKEIEAMKDKIEKLSKKE